MRHFLIMRWGNADNIKDNVANRGVVGKCWTANQQKIVASDTES